MWKQSVWSASITAHLATQFLNQNGVVTLPGAAAAANATPGMIGYGMAKAAVHHLVKSLAEKSSGLPENSFVAAILP
jgi:dihydropteridine reductase